MTNNDKQPFSAPSSQKDDLTTDFGFRSVPVTEKNSLVREVFDSVAERYDIMNDLMSLGVHRLWKRMFITELAPRRDHMLLDLAGGTGDISFGWLKAGGGSVILSDINESMLTVGRKRAVSLGLISQVELAVVDAEHIPLPDCSVDRVSIAFGLRNCTDKDAVLREAYRTLKPGGSFLCLEFSRVTIDPLARLYDLWSFQALPRIGQMVAKDRESYQYLAESIRTFPDQETLAAMMQDAGFERTSYINLSGGIAAIHRGWRI